MNRYCYVLGLIFLGTNLVSCGAINGLQDRARIINNYERTSYYLSKENRLLNKEVADLKFKINELQNKNEFLSLKLKKNVDRKLASIGPVDTENDLVEYQVYRWSPEQLLTTAMDEFQQKNFEKASQFFKTLLVHHPYHRSLTDEVFFIFGVSAYESKKYNDWAKDSFKNIIQNHPKSSYFRGAKLWNGLLKLRDGRSREFFSVVEEFRKKYRNTREWKLISRHYNDIYKKYR